MSIELALDEMPLLERYIAVREQRLYLDRQSRDLQAREDAIKYEITSLYSNDSLVIPNDIKFTYDEKPVPFVEDWAAFTQWIIDNDAPDVLQKRITESAIKARLDAGVTLPGVVMLKKPVITVGYMETKNDR